MDIKESEAFERKIANELSNQHLIKKYIYNAMWISGEETEVYPIQIWIENKEIEFQLKSSAKKHYFSKFVKRICEKYKGTIERTYYSNNHGDCPDTLTFYLK